MVWVGACFCLRRKAYEPSIALAQRGYFDLWKRSRPRIKPSSLRIHARHSGAGSAAEEPRQMPDSQSPRWSAIRQRGLSIVSMVEELELRLEENDIGDTATHQVAT